MADQRSARRDNVLWLGAALLTLAALVTFRLVVIGDAYAQSGAAWPTPPDVLSQVLVAAPLLVLYLLGVAVAALAER